jgi:hypothetical protein
LTCDLLSVTVLDGGLINPLTHTHTHTQHTHRPQHTASQAASGRSRSAHSQLGRALCDAVTAHALSGREGREDSPARACPPRPLRLGHDMGRSSTLVLLLLATAAATARGGERSSSLSLLALRSTGVQCRTSGSAWRRCTIACHRRLPVPLKSLCWGPRVPLFGAAARC